MKKSGWKDIAELVGIAAIVASLVLVAYELRQNTASVQSATSQGLLEQNNQFNMELATDHAFAELIYKGDTEIDDLSAVERLQYRSYLTARFNVWEQAYYGYTEETLSEELWHDYDAGGSHRVCQPSAREIWAEVEWFFGVEFRGYVNKGISSQCDRADK